MKLLKIINFIIKKIKYLFRKKVILPRKACFPLTFELVVEKNAELEIKDGFHLNRNVTIKVRENAKCNIGKDVFLNNGCIITCMKSIKIGNGAIFGPNVMIFDHDHNYKSNNYAHEFISEDIIIEDNCWIGANAIILKGTHIKKNTIVAAGSIVKGTVDENTIFYNERNEKKKHYEKIK